MGPTREKTMKKLISAALLAAMATGASAEDVKLQLKWVTQAQFAGYYVAQAKGTSRSFPVARTLRP
jgi:ABC-type nitrate/sulfonate/bicarbonate transport system substrate-binding protein